MSQSAALVVFDRIVPNPSRVHLRLFVEEAAASLPAGSTVLDAGSGEGMYRHLFAEHIYESADFAAVPGEPYGPLDYVYDLASIPVDDNRYDLILLTQVMEHLPEPLVVLEELRRVLKSQGTLWLSAPLFYPEHEAPYDFFRYTRFGLDHLLTQARFAVERIERLGGYAAVFAEQAGYAVKHLPLAPSAYGGGVRGSLGALTAVATRAGCLAVAALYSRLDARHPWKGSALTKNHVAVARKT